MSQGGQAFQPLSAHMSWFCAAKLHPFAQPSAALNQTLRWTQLPHPVFLPPRSSVCTWMHTIPQPRLRMFPEPRMPPSFPQTCTQMTPWWLSNKSFIAVLQILLFIVTSKEVWSMYHVIQMLNHAASYYGNRERCSLYSFRDMSYFNWITSSTLQYKFINLYFLLFHCQRWYSVCSWYWWELQTYFYAIYLLVSFIAYLNSSKYS